MPLDPEALIKMYRAMLRIRRFEEQIWEVYTGGLMHGLAHLYIGEEAVAVGVCSALRNDDFITSTHRGHGHCVAKGGDLEAMMAEVMGRVTGHCRGKGGSMHIADMSVGILGANGIVGGGFGIATGAALSARQRGTDQVAVCFFGDGASNQGIFFEVMNFAAIWKLPVIYVCENNQYGEYTPTGNVTAGSCIADRSAPFGIPSTTVDGHEALAVHEAAVEAVVRARKGGGATLIECNTYRHRGHHVGDPGEDYRPQEERDAWMEKDPIQILRQKMIDDKLASEAELDAEMREVESEMANALAAAKAASYPDITEVSEHVYA